jgi:hypothetical protein
MSTNTSMVTLSTSVQAHQTLTNSPYEHVQTFRMWTKLKDLHCYLTYLGGTTKKNAILTPTLYGTSTLDSTIGLHAFSHMKDFGISLRLHVSHVFDNL